MAFFLWLLRIQVFPHFLAILREQPSASSFKLLCEMGTEMQDSSSNKIHFFLGCAVGAKPDPTTAITSHQCTQALQKCLLKVSVNNKFNGEKNEFQSCARKGALPEKAGAPWVWMSSQHQPVEQGIFSVLCPCSPCFFLCLFFCSPRARKHTVCVWMTPDRVSQGLKDTLTSPEGRGL